MSETATKATFFTPGPWFESDGEIVSESKPGGVAFAEVVMYQSAHPTTWHANMRLIAAAPELFEACRRLRSLIHDLGVQDADDAWYDAIERADAVIAKVEG